MRRFERIHDVVEPVEEYRDGGYHPVHLGDVFNGRYKVLGKLAFGQYSTVWIAMDQQHQKQVSLKIIKAKPSHENKELETFLHLSQFKLDHPGKGNVLELMDHFEHQGPNGRHLCLILPVMLCDGETARGMTRSVNVLKALSKQITLGVDYIHRTGLIHCDLQPANIMFADATTTLSLLEPEMSPVRWLNEAAVDNSAPRYLLPSQKSSENWRDMDLSTIIAKIGDFGGTTWRSSLSHEAPVTPRALRAPEVIQHEPWDIGIDTWALSCLMFQLATQEPLFPIGGFGINATQFDEEHRRLITDVLGSDLPGFETYLEERLNGKFGTQNIRQFASFLGCMLQRDPQQRKSTTQLLQHPWICVESKH